MRNVSMWLAAGTSVALAVPAHGRTPEQVAEEALREAPVWDGHNDVPIQLRGRFGDVIAAFDFEDTTDTGGDEGDGAWKGRTMHTDLARLRKGKVGAQFWSVFVSADLPEPEAVQATLEQIDVTRRLIAKYPRDLAFARTSRDVARAMGQGRIASLLGIEGGYSIGSSLGVLRQMHALGVRYMTLTHYRNVSWADSSADPPKSEGLSDFGRLVVREMNRLGMLVDLSHTSAETMLDALDEVKAPVMFSHSGARGLVNSSRNVPDAVLRRLPANGGIVMVIAYPSFASEERRVWGAALDAETARTKALFPGEPEAATRVLDAWRAANPEPLATVSQMADHVDHIRKIAGIDHIGIGGDYDGMRSGPKGMEDVSGYPLLFAELARRGYSKQDLEKISSRNMMRVMRASERYAAAHASDPPIEASLPAAHD